MDGGASKTYHVVEFANSTRLVKFAKIKPGEIFGVYSSQKH